MVRARPAASTFGAWIKQQPGDIVLQAGVVKCGTPLTVSRWSFAQPPSCRRA